MSRLLLVEDDAALAAMVAEYLQRAGYHVDHVARGDQAVARIQTAPPDLVLLDVELPGLDGFEVVRRVRPTWAGPILMLTARGDEIDQVVGLELGATAYLPKPVSPRLLLAHVRAHLRQPAGDVLELGALAIDVERREARLGGVDLELGDAEFDLLLQLARRPGAIVSRDDLLGTLRGLEYDGLDRSVDQRVSRLRRAFGEAGRKWIKTVRGEGYLLAPPR